MSPEKSIGYIFLSAEALIAAYVIYLMFGLWGAIISTIVFVVIIFLSIWLISYKYEKSNLFKEPEKATKENFRAVLVFKQVLDYLVSFPIKAILIYYIYFNFSNGILYIALYLLFLVISNQSWRNRNTQEANSVFNKLMNKNHENT